MGWEKIFENYINGFTSKIHKELMQLSKKLFKNEQRNQIDILQIRQDDWHHQSFGNTIQKMNEVSLTFVEMAIIKQTRCRCLLLVGIQIFQPLRKAIWKLLLVKTSLVTQLVKNQLVKQETLVWLLGQKTPEEEQATLPVFLGFWGSDGK